MNLTQNMQVAKSLAGQFWSGILNAASPGGAASAGGAAGAYIGLVQTGGPWDPKTTLGMTAREHSGWEYQLRSDMFSVWWKHLVGRSSLPVWSGYLWKTEREQALLLTEDAR